MKSAAAFRQAAWMAAADELIAEEARRSNASDVKQPAPVHSAPVLRAENVGGEGGDLT